MVEVLQGGARIRLEAESELAHIVLAAQRPMLMFFWSTSCKPCREQLEIVDKLVAEAPERFVVAMVNVEEVPGIAERLAILGLPTLVFFRQGREEQRFVGLTSFELLKEQIQP